MIADEANMIEVSVFRRAFCALIVCFFCAAFLVQTTLTAQGARGNTLPLKSNPDSGSFFFATSHDTKLGALAWLLCLDSSHQSGKMYIAPHMVKLSNVELDKEGILTFRSDEFLGNEYRFRGRLSSTGLVGELQLVNIKSGNATDKWELSALPLRLENTKANSGLPAPDERYSNAAYSDEGGDQTGVDIRLFSTSAGATGMIVFFESYWGEPTFTPLALTHVVREKGAIHFEVELPNGVAHYHLLTRATGALFNREDVQRVEGEKDLYLKRIRAMF